MASWRRTSGRALMQSTLLAAAAEREGGGSRVVAVDVAAGKRALDSLNVDEAGHGGEWDWGYFGGTLCKGREVQRG
jgi:hypothetical protein